MSSDGYNFYEPIKTFDNIFERLDRIEKCIQGEEKNQIEEEEINREINFDVKLNADLNDLKDAEDQLEKIKELCKEINFPHIQPVINLYGCSFNFGEGCAEARYYNGDEVYNPRKEN